MWAQLITLDVKAEKVTDLPAMYAHLQAIEQPNSGLVRTSVFQDAKNPTRAYVLVVFASEEQARARERDPRRAQGLAELQVLMAEMLDGAPQFVDLTVLRDLASAPPAP